MAHEVVHPLEEEVRLASLRPVYGLALRRLEPFEPRAIGRDLVGVEHVDGEVVAFSTVLLDGPSIQQLRHGNSSSRGSAGAYHTPRPPFLCTACARLG